MKSLKRTIIILCIFLCIFYALTIAAFIYHYNDTYIKNIIIYASPIVLVVSIVIMKIVLDYERRKVWKFHELLVGSFKDGMAFYDANRKKVLHVSYNIESILGVSKDSVLNLKNLVFEPNVDLIKEITNFIVTRPTENDELNLSIINQQTKKLVNLNFRFVRIIYEKNPIYVIIISDVTQQYNDTMLLSRKLLKEQENSVKMKDFLSRVSHEIRTPLNAVIGMNQMAIDYLDSDDKESAVKCCHNVSKSGEYLFSVINNILDFNKLDSGKMEVSKEKFRLNDVLYEVQNILKSQIDDKEIDFEIEAPDNNPQIVTDKLKLTQIIVNLASNAIKYNRIGGFVKIAANHEYIDEYKIKTQLEISDNGIGMSDEFIAKLFTPFAQEHRQTTTPSSGLGLVITKGLVQLLDGKISVKTKLNKGSSFKVEFIFETSKKQEIVAKNETPSLVGLRCLIAEDNQINSEICIHLLKTMGIEADSTKDGDLVCKQFFSTPEYTYDFILMDIQMPCVNGYDATKRIRKSQRDDKMIPIIAFTADAYEDDIKKAILSGMDGHVSKPVTKESLMQAIESVLQKSEYKRK